MHRAAMKGDLERVRQLIDGGVSVVSRDDFDRTPLHWAADQGRNEVVEFLSSLPECELNLKDRDGCTPVMLAAQWGWYEVVDFLSNLPQCELNLKDSRGRTPLMLAASMGSRGIVDLLLQRGAQVNCPDDLNCTLLHMASSNNWADIVHRILNSREIDINAATTYGDTPLMRAASRESKDVAALLIRAGADVHQSDPEKKTALHVAAYHGCSRVVQVLLEKEGLDLNPQDKGGYTPLHDACRGGCPEVVKQLLVAGADTTIRDTQMSTALHLAAHHGCSRVVQVLLDKEGLDLNPQDEYGYTPLHDACFYGCPESVKELLVAGADTTLKNNNDETAFSVGIRQDKFTLVEIGLFVQHGAFLQDCDYKQISEDPFLKENVLNDVGLCTQSIVNKFHRQSLPALKSISNLARKLPCIDKFKLNARQIDEVENLVKWEIERNTFCNVVKAHPMALSALCVLSLITCQSGTE